MSRMTSDPGDTTASDTTPSDTTASDTTASSTIKDPDDWTTGDEPATGAQMSYLGTLAREAGRDVPESLSKADASKLIDELQGQSPRAQDVPDVDAQTAEPPD